MTTEVPTESTEGHSFSPDVHVPPRTRTFDTDDAKRVLAMFKGEAEGQEKPSENVGYGTFDTKSAARGAGVTLNRLLVEVGAPHKYSITTFPRDGKFVGVLLNKKAKDAPKPKANNTAASGTRRARSRR